MSESIDEVEWTCQLDVLDHPDKILPHNQDKNNHNHHCCSPHGRSDAEIFHSHGFLTYPCIMAHAVYLTDQDVTVLQDSGAAIAHCPLSNFYFAGGCLQC
jgi:cytosine/adenosine deaminase-related metal-dependent hydrolase